MRRHAIGKEPKLSSICYVRPAGEQMLSAAYGERWIQFDETLEGGVESVLAN